MRFPLASLDFCCSRSLAMKLHELGRAIGRGVLHHVPNTWKDLQLTPVHMFREPDGMRVLYDPIAVTGDNQGRHSQFGIA